MLLAFRVLLAAFLFTSLARASHAQSPTADMQVEPVHRSWLTVHDGGGHLHLERGYTVRFEGIGRLKFGADRRRVRVETESPLRVLVNGTQVRGRRPLTNNETLGLHTADAAVWNIRLASEAETRAVSDATRIRDDRPDSPARFDTNEPTVFFLRIDEYGGSTFIYPESAP